MPNQIPLPLEGERPGEGVVSSTYTLTPTLSLKGEGVVGELCWGDYMKGLGFQGTTCVDFWIALHWGSESFELSRAKTNSYAG